MLQCKWTHSVVTTPEQAQEMCDLFRSLRPEIGAFDTETTGLHINVDVPFLFQWGFVNKERTKGWTYLVDIEKQPVFAKSVISAWHNLTTELSIYVAHNTKFDLHMLENIGLPYRTENLSDTMFYIRYAHNNLTPDNGGPPLKLKEYCAQFVDHAAKTHEKLLDREKTAITKRYNEQLKQMLKACGKPPQEFEAASYTLKVIDTIFKDNIFHISDLEPKVRELYLQWFSDLPLPIQKRKSITMGILSSEDIPYTMLNRDNLYQYAHMDIVYCLETLIKLEPTVKARENDIGLKIDNDCILPLFEMERVGFDADKQYLQDSKERVRLYIKQQRNALKTTLGEAISVGQHARMLQLLNERFNLNIESTNNELLEHKLSDLIRAGEENNKEPIRAIQLIQELRTLEKWYSAYIIRFLSALELSPRLYTTIGQVGTVSGRVVSDFQQFPRDPILDENGNELFYPRKMVKCSPNMKGIVYLDYSQIELRIQAMYTILCGTPDLKLCRAYMPYRCYARQYPNPTPFLFDYENTYHIKHYWNQKWFKNEDHTEWTPTDVHSETTITATGLTPDHPDFKSARSDVGKRTNFAKNYGAELGRIKQMFPRKSEDECKRINDAYYLTYPGIKGYHEYCKDAAWQMAGVPNLFGVKYYGCNGHKLKNLLIQGSAAYLFKIKMREQYDFFKQHPKYKSRYQMNIHDEMSWELHPDDPPEIFFEIKELMENWADTLVPIVAEMSYTSTTWAEKKDIHNMEELLKCTSMS